MRGYTTSPRHLLRPLLWIAVSLSLALALYSGYVGGVWVQPIAEWTARWSSVGIGLIGIPTSVDGTVLASDSFAVNIVAECTALGPLALFTGAVLACRSTMRAKAIGMALGLATLSLINIVRITSLFWIGSNYPHYLDMAHLLVWQTAIILCAIVLWLFWVERFARAGDR